MKTVASTVTALALALLLAVPVLAGGAQADTVTQTLELTLHGVVPQDRVFGTFYYISPENHPAGLIQFCGPPVEGGEPPSQVVSREACTGDGTAYRAEVEFKHGSGVFVEFITLSVNDPRNTLEIFAEIPKMEEPERLEYATIEADVTTSASYSFSAGGGPEAPRLPATGAGETARDGLRISTIAVGLSFLAMGGYVLRRSRRTTSGDTQ